MPEYVQHTLAPLFDKNSKVLILGTMPSPKSRAFGFYYSHPQNRFWRVLSDVFQQALPVTNDEKAAFCLYNHIALWDVLQSVPIRTICTTGTKAAALYKRLCLPSTGRPALAMPSTSPANCRHYPYTRLVEAYAILPDLCFP